MPMASAFMPYTGIMGAMGGAGGFGKGNFILSFFLFIVSAFINALNTMY